MKFRQLFGDHGKHRRKKQVSQLVDFLELNDDRVGDVSNVLDGPGVERAYITANIGSELVSRILPQPFLPEAGILFPRPFQCWWSVHE